MLNWRRRPVTPLPVIYTLTEWTGSSMLVLPPRSSANPEPLYRIAVELDLNPLMPASILTRVLRVGKSSQDDDNPLVNDAPVGEFSMSLNHKRGHLTMDGISTRLSKVISSRDGSRAIFDWTFGEVHLRWDCTSKLDDGSPMSVCYRMIETLNSRNGDVQVATFVSPPFDASPPLPDASLTVFPQGHAVMDHLVLSALVVIRILTR
ncbi:hypothetical protein BKA70DRAFT_1103756 [Coprinopsis sp. MPI-PUGE-AT-0042]|nr:hypothetical protein BKA70DRAFT_1103756 [Coprinopsis sp. MPI-PUGE-AT-0042]